MKVQIPKSRIGIAPARMVAFNLLLVLPGIIAVVFTNLISRILTLLTFWLPQKKVLDNCQATLRSDSMRLHRLHDFP